MASDVDFTQAVELTRRHLESLFPKRCSKCGREYASLREYLGATKHVGAPISYDAAGGDYRPLRPVGTMSLANCPCGTTLALGTDGMSLRTVWRLMAFGRRETKRRGITFEQLLSEVRASVDAQVLGEPAASGAGPEPDPVDWRTVLAHTHLDATVFATPPLIAIWALLRAGPPSRSPSRASRPSGPRWSSRGCSCPRASTATSCRCSSSASARRRSPSSGSRPARGSSW